MMSKLVSDLFDISEFAHHGPENRFYLSGKDRRCFYLPVLYQQKTCTAADPPGDRDVCVFLPPECEKMQENLHGKNRRKIGDVNASLQDTLSGIRVVQSFANEDIERAKFKKSNEAFLVSKRDNYHCMGSFMSSNLFLPGHDVPGNSCLRRLSDRSG